MNGTAWVVLVYGILVAAGGVMGWVKAQSRPSLVAGLAFGILLVVSALGLGRERPWGLWGSAGLTLFLLLFFGYRFVSSDFRLMPGGVSFLLSLVAFVVLVNHLFRS